MFDKHGLNVTRFSASECLDNANGVVEEFLEFFE
jgi:very-short-patch-repair endonuclease